MEHNFYAVLSRMKYITLLGIDAQHPAGKHQQHSQDVAVLICPGGAHQPAVFGGQGGPGAVCFWLFIPRRAGNLRRRFAPPVKYYNPAIRDAYRQVEDVSARKLLSCCRRTWEDYRPCFSPQEAWREECRLVKRRINYPPSSNMWRRCARATPEFASARRAYRRRSAPCAARRRLLLEEFLPAYQLVGRAGLTSFIHAWYPPVCCTPADFSTRIGISRRCLRILIADRSSGG